MKATEYWHKIDFWTKINNTIQVIGTFTQLSLIFGDAQHIYNVLVAFLQLAGMILPIWFTDKDGDGNVDLFKKEVTTVVTSETPITVETKTETQNE